MRRDGGAGCMPRQDEEFLEHIFGLSIYLVVIFGFCLPISMEIAAAKI
jgi:hypothetical protein